MGNIKARIPTIILMVAILLIFLFATNVVSPMDLFNWVLLQPMLNFLAMLSRVLGGSFGLAIIVLTIIVLIILMPLYMSQVRSSKAMQQLQPKIKELQKKYAKDKERLGQEQMKLWKESGVNPAGCGFSMLIQFPIWIALYQSVIQGLAYAPENLFGLSKQLYSWSFVQGAVPFNSHFLWLDLGHGDIVMAFLTAASMWVLQKMSSSGSVDPSGQQNVMQWAMPIFFGYMAYVFPSGLALYWFVSTVLRAIMQYRATGWGSLQVPAFVGRVFPRLARATDANPGGIVGGNVEYVKPKGGKDEPATGGEVPEKAEDVASGTTSRRRKVRDGKHRGKRKNRGRSRRSGPG